MLVVNKCELTFPCTTLELSGCRCDIQAISTLTISKILTPGGSMSSEERVKELEENVSRLQIEVAALRELMIKQVAVNNITFKGKYDEVIIQLAKEYEERGLDNEMNSQMHEALRQYIKYQLPAVE
jgi:copper homeostasis protein CutC